MQLYRNLPKHIEYMISRLELDTTNIIKTKTNTNFSAPIDVDNIVAKMHISVKYQQKLNDGIYGSVQTDTKEILLSDIIQTKVRERFVICHEIGHIFYDSKQQKFAKHHYDEVTTSGTVPEEIYANAFSASLLVPELLLKNALKTTRNIELLSNIFQVSKFVIEYRVKRFFSDYVYIDNGEVLDR